MVDFYSRSSRNEGSCSHLIEIGVQSFHGKNVDDSGAERREGTPDRSNLSEPNYVVSSPGGKDVKDQPIKIGLKEF